MITKYLYLAAAGALLAAFGLTGYLAYNAGVDHEKAATARIIEEERERQKLVIDKLEAEKAKRAIVYREKIKVVRTAFDHTGCADSIIVAGILERLLPESGNSKARLSPDGSNLQTGVGVSYLAVSGRSLP